MFSLLRKLPQNISSLWENFRFSHKTETFLTKAEFDSELNSPQGAEIQIFHTSFVFQADLCFGQELVGLGRTDSYQNNFRSL